MPPLSRRRVLRGAAAVPAVGLAGCSVLGGDCEPRTTLTLTPVSTADVARDAAPTADRGGDTATDQLGPLDAALARAAVESGATTYHTAHERPMPDGEWFLRVDGTYYEYAVARVEAVTVPGTVLRLHQDAVTDADGQSGDALAFGSMPAHDRRTVLALLESAGAAFFPNFTAFFEEREAVTVRRAVGYPDGRLVEESRLVPEPTHGYLGFRDHYFSMTADGAADVDVTTYEITAARTEVSAVADAWLAKVGLDLADRELSADQRDVLEQAIEDEYVECEPYSEALVGLDQILAPHLYVRYEGTWYEEWLVESG